MPKKGKSYINLEQLAGGAFAEKLNEALLQVAENIQNPNTDAVAKRGITINLRFVPNRSRQIANTTISVTTKLAATEAIDTQIAMGLNMRTGELEIAEYDGQIRGQMRMSDYNEPEDEDEPETAEATNSRPLDLKARTRQRVDPDTGEILDEEPARQSGSNLVAMFDKATQA